MQDVYEECEKKYGKPIDLAIKSTYNPKTKKYFGFSPSFTPDPINWRKDLWDDVGIVPDSWEKILDGGRKIKQKHKIPVGIGLAQELDTAMAVRTIMYSFGAHEQDVNGYLTLNSKNTVEAVKFVKALFQEAMTPEVFTWDPSSNNRAMLAGTISLALNAVSITRTGEKDNPAFTEKIHLAKAAAGPVRRIGLEHVMDVYVIWKFAENIDGAKKFLVDYVGNFRQAFTNGEFYDFPCFQRTVPDLKELIAKDAKAKPSDKYCGPGGRAELGHQHRLPWLCQRGHRRGLPEMGHQRHVRQSGPRRAESRGCGQRGRGRMPAHLAEVARAEADIA